MTIILSIVAILLLAFAVWVGLGIPLIGDVWSKDIENNTGTNTNHQESINMNIINANEYAATAQVIADAIARSTSQNEIVTIETPERLREDIEAKLGAESMDAAIDTDTGVSEYWGQNIDDVEWRVHVRSTNDVHCRCGDVTGVSCGWTGPRSGTIVVEHMPRQHRASHEAAGNRGTFPHNGAVRLRVERSCAALLVEDDGDWTSIVDEARA